MARQANGGRRDVFGVIVGIVVLIALGVSLLTGSSNGGQQIHFFAASGGQPDRPVLPIINRPSGQ